MGYLTGLAAVREVQAKKAKARGDFADRPKTRYVSSALKDDGDSIKIQFAQELDKDAQNYSEKNGLGRFVLEHSNPDNFKKKAECTKDDGQCYGCDQGWTQKVTLYINAIVDDGTNEPWVGIWNRGLAEGSVAELLLEFAAEDETITDKWFKLKRSGKGTKTTYMLMPGKASDLNVEDFEMFDLDHVPFKVAPERQEAYYLDGQAPATEAPKVATPSSGVDAEW